MERGDGTAAKGSAVSYKGLHRVYRTVCTICMLQSDTWVSAWLIQTAQTVRSNLHSTLCMRPHSLLRLFLGVVGQGEGVHGNGFAGEANRLLLGWGVLGGVLAEEGDFFQVGGAGVFGVSGYGDPGGLQDFGDGGEGGVVDDAV